MARVGWERQAHTWLFYTLAHFILLEAEIATSIYI